MIEKKRLGKTDLICSTLGFGTWGIAGTNNVSGVPIGWQPLSQQQIGRTVSAAIDNGINFFDSSDFYGNGKAEEMLGTLLPPNDTNIVIATKVGIIPHLINNGQSLARNFSPDHIESSINNSLKRLRRECVDLYQLHGPNLEKLDEATWEALSRLKEKGKIRYVGVSVKSSRSDSADIHALIENDLVSSIQVRYNLLHTRHSSHLDNIDTKGCAILARSVYEHGFLTGKYSSSYQFPPLDHRSRKFTTDLADQIESFFGLVKEYFPECSDDRYILPLRYALSGPNVSIAIIGVTSEQQIQQNILAAEMPPLPVAIREAIRKIASETFIGLDGTQ